MKTNRIMFAGPSGIGKTTLAKYLSSDTLPFISGSVSDLLPTTKDKPHSEMLKSNKEDLYTQDFQILNLRKKLFSENENFVSDRSFLDSAAYFILKQSDSIPQCEMDHFLELCKMCLCLYCDKLIVLNFTPYMVKNWVIEDNNKRILNRYFQAHISYIISMVLDNWEVEFTEPIFSISQGWFKLPKTIENGGYQLGTIKSLYGSVKVLKVNEPELLVREQIISSWLSHE